MKFTAIQHMKVFWTANNVHYVVHTNSLQLANNSKIDTDLHLQIEVGKTLIKYLSRPCKQQGKALEVL